jgi:transposase InsO family protein
MLVIIRAIHAELKGAYGSPRMLRELRLRGFTASKERVERLMREHGLHARHKRRYKVTTDSKHALSVATLADNVKIGFAASRILLWYQTQPCCHIAGLA